MDRKIKRSQSQLKALNAITSRIPMPSNVDALIDKVTQIVAVVNITLCQQIIGTGDRDYFGYPVNIDEHATWHACPNSHFTCARFASLGI